MARSKKHLYPIEDQLISAAAQALFHPARLAILRFLKKNGTQRVAVIAKGHPISKESLSDHLQILYQHKLVLYKERFPYSFYTLHVENAMKALAEIESFCNEFLKN